MKNPPKQKNNSSYYLSNGMTSQSKGNDNTIEYYPTMTQVINQQLSLTDFLRTSSESIPDNEFLIRNTGIPFGINLTPFPDIDSSLISQYSYGGGNGKIPRCKQCHSFINPFCELEHNS
jgi:hypothetical protein